MRNLIQFISKYSFFFLFLLFEVFAFYLLLRNNHFQQSSFINSTNFISGGLFEKYAELTDYVNLKEINQSLSEENIRLKQNQKAAFQKIYGPNYLIDDTLHQAQYFYTKAKIINNSTNKQNNYLTLNVGSLNGIEKGMGVVGPNGVIGVVKDVSRHYSSVLSVLHSNAKISAKLKDQNYFGSMQWNGKNYRYGLLTDIPNHVKIAKGDTIVTNGFSATFPAGITMATIEEFEKIEGENFYDIQVKFTQDYKNLVHVYVVKNIFKNEQLKLESETVEDHG
tara:strand:+ start:1117 stop:1953 length:837 start_codon:yes stop_codon:yes gene_type:complete